jgi:hypothetical protein
MKSSIKITNLKTGKSSAHVDNKVRVILFHKIKLEKGTS